MSHGHRKYYEREGKLIVYKNRWICLHTRRIRCLQSAC